MYQYNDGPSDRFSYLSSVNVNRGIDNITSIQSSTDLQLNSYVRVTKALKFSRALTFLTGL